MPEMRKSSRMRRAMSSEPSVPHDISHSAPQETEVMRDFGGPHLDHRSKPQKNYFIKGLVTIAIIAVIGGVIAYAFNAGLPSWGQKQKKFHAVFLANGQVFFGNIMREDDDNVVLSNVFYVQMVSQQIPPKEEGGQPETVQVPQLIKKGKEFYGPTGAMRINRAQVTVIEELAPDSSILKEIEAQLE